MIYTPQVIRNAEIHTVRDLVGTQVIDLTDLGNVTGNIGVFFCTVFFGDVPQCIAGRNADTGVVFVGWSFRLTVCLRILRREVED